MTWIPLENDASQNLVRRVKSLIDLPLTAKLGHKLQNPALHLFRVTGFLGNHKPLSNPLFLFGVERRNLVRKYCLISFPIKAQQKSMEIGQAFFTPELPSGYLKHSAPPKN